jgi:hypothetical protein
MAAPWIRSRREFIRLATVAAAAFAAGCPTEPLEPEPTPAPPDPDPCGFDPDPAWLAPSPAAVGLPHLGGAPDTEEGWTVAAFVDTVVPGAHWDPTGAVGGIDVGVPGMFFDPELPAAEFVGVLVGFLDSVAAGSFEGETFAFLTSEQRIMALDQAMTLDLMGLAVQLAKLGYYSSADAACHLGYPGANPGWVDDEDFSFGVAMATEITEDGNHP